MKIPHYVRDYRSLATGLIKRHGRDRAMQIGIGSDWSVGKLELACLTHFGLRPGNFMVDVGCGSGRLAAAISSVPGIRYHGTDVVLEFLDHAREVSPNHFRFSHVSGLTIPEINNSADMVSFFSVATHLHLHETYVYMQEASRVLKPGGYIVLSFLEMQNPHHWPIFNETAIASRAGNLTHLNAFIESQALRVCASKLSLIVEDILHGGTPSIPISEPIVHDDGRVQSGLADFGQSIAVFRKL